MADNKPATAMIEMVRRDSFDMQPIQRRLSTDTTPAREQAPPIRADRNLNSLDVACLIINKMVGTGIFTSPFTTLVATRSKSLAFVFWILGFAYTILSMSLYLEYARDLPYTGGEMIYLDHVFKKPRLLAFTMYAFYFMTIYTLVPNNLQFAYHALKAANIDDAHIDRDLLCFIAFVVTTFVCLLMFFSSVNSRWLNTSTAIAKVLLLLGVFVAGCTYIARHGVSTGHGSEWGFNSSGIGWTQGIISVFFAYHGWENATFVSGEIPRYEILRKGFIAAVFIVGVLYVAIAGVVCAAFSWDLSITPNGQNFMAVFFGNDLNAEKASAILICLSSLGSMVSIAYTSVRVKQVIGWLNVLPLSKLWRRTDLSRKLRYFVSKPGSWFEAVGQAGAVRRGTPEGGIILHFIFSLIMLGVTRSITDLHESFTIPGTLLISGHFIFEVLIGFGYAFVFKPGTLRTRDLSSTEWDAPEPYEWFIRRRIGPILLGTSTGVIGLFVVTTQLVYDPGWWFVLIIASLCLCTGVYWAIFVRCSTTTPSNMTSAESQRRSERRLFGFRLQAHVHGEDDIRNPWRQCSRCAKFTPSRAHRHREDGYLEYNSVQPVRKRNVLTALSELLEGDVEDVGRDLDEDYEAHESDTQSLEDNQQTSRDIEIWDTYGSTSGHRSSDARGPRSES